MDSGRPDTHPEPGASVSSETLRDVSTLLERCAAFRGVVPERIETLAASAEILYLAQGSGVPADLTRRPLVVQRGALQVRDEDGRTVDLVPPGEFVAAAQGQHLVASAPSMLVLLPDDASALAWSAGRVGASRSFDIDVAGASVHDVMSRPVHTVHPDVTCQEAAVMMRRHRISSLVVTPHAGDAAAAGPVRGPVGIVTLRDLRDRLVAAGRSGDTPVADIATTPARTIAPDVLVGEAVVTMLAAGFHHLPVMAGDDLVGMVAGDDLLRAQTRNPLFVLRGVGRTRDQVQLAEALAGVPTSVAMLLSAGTSATQITRIVSTVTDRVMARLIRFAVDEADPVSGGAWHGRTPSFRWLVLGSQARSEQTLHTDQDTAMLLPAGLDPPARTWTAALSARVTKELVALGYGRCHGGVMASEEDWRLDAPTWQSRVTRWIAEPSAANVMHAQIAFDLREVPLGQDGHRDAEVPMAGGVHRAAVDAVAAAPLFLGRLARESLRHRPPLGFLGRFVVERGGAHAGTLDLKAGALLPIMNAARLHALAIGSPALSTRERLAAAMDAGVLSAELGTVLREGHELAQRLRLEQQLAARESGATPGNHVDPATLSPLVRSDLREVFKAVRTAQEAIESRWRTGLLG